MTNRESNPALWDKCEEQLERVLATAEKITSGDKILLVGPNASGKSLFRGVLKGSKDKAFEHVRVCHSSMALRTGTHSEMGGLGVVMRDMDSDATSCSTVLSIRKAIQSVESYLKDNPAWALHIDEPEVGFGEELQMGTGAWLRAKLDALTCQPLATIITTHSSHIAKAFLDWKLVDLGFKHTTVKSWISRKKVPVDPEALVEINNVMFSVIQTRINNNRTKKA